MSELNIHNLKLHFVAFRDIPLSTFTDLQALLSEEEKSCTTFDPLTTKVPTYLCERLLRIICISITVSAAEQQRCIGRAGSGPGSVQGREF